MTGAASREAEPSDAVDRRATEERDADGGLDADEAVAAIRDRAEAIGERERETALTTLEARGELSETDRAAVEALADRLVDGLVAVPERGLRATETGGTAAGGSDTASSDGATEERIATALELFG